MCRPTEVEPTKVTPLTSGLVSSESASTREQVTRLTTPLGRPASISSSSMRIEVCGTIDAALRTKVLPVVMQKGSIQPIGIIAGKLYGAMPTKTPSGSRYETVS